MVTMEKTKTVLKIERLAHNRFVPEYKTEGGNK